MARNFRTQRVTAKSIIEGGLLAGTPDAEILAAVHASLPDSAADQTHIAYYRSKLTKENRMEKLEGETVATPREDTPYLGELERIEIGGQSFTLFGSKIRTDISAQSAGWGVVLRAYQALTGDTRSDVSPVRARTVIRYALLEAWHRIQEIPVPENITHRMEQAKQEALVATKKADETTAAAVAVKEPRVTTKSVITAGLLAGKSDEDIVAEVKEHFPEGKADSTHVSYYRSKMYKDGTLERPAKAEKPAKVAAAPATVPAPKSTAGAKAAATTARPVAKASPARSAKAAVNGR